MCCSTVTTSSVPKLISVDFQDIFPKKIIVVVCFFSVFLTSIDVDADLGSAAKTMLIVGTEGGKILKIIVDNGARSTSLLEEREVFNAEKCGTNKCVCWVRSGQVVRRRCMLVEQLFNFGCFVSSFRAVRKVHIDKEIGRLMVVFQDCVVAAPLCAVRTDCRK